MARSRRPAPLRLRNTTRAGHHWNNIRRGVPDRTGQAETKERFDVSKREVWHGDRIVAALLEVRGKVDRYDQDIGDIQNRLLEIIDIWIAIVPPAPTRVPKRRKSK